VSLFKEVNVNMTLTVQITEPALKTNVLTPALFTVLVARVHFVTPHPIGQFVAAQVVGLVTLTLNVIYMSVRSTKIVP
jgi:hypothetical protein